MSLCHWWSWKSLRSLKFVVESMMVASDVDLDGQSAGKGEVDDINSRLDGGCVIVQGTDRDYQHPDVLF